MKVLLSLAGCVVLMYGLLFGNLVAMCGGPLGVFLLFSLIQRDFDN